MINLTKSILGSLLHFIVAYAVYVTIGPKLIHGSLVIVLDI